MSRKNVEFPKRLAAPAKRALILAGFTRLDMLAGIPLSRVTTLHGVGPKAVTILQKALDQEGLPRMK
jgi:hypothetical protein